jgi:hypothetical protein
MTNEFDVVGERKDDDLHLLVRGDDGKHYDYSVTSEQVSPVEPDERWRIDRELATDEAEPEGGEGDDPRPESGDESPIG